MHNSPSLSRLRQRQAVIASSSDLLVLCRICKKEKERKMEKKKRQKLGHHAQTLFTDLKKKKKRRETFSIYIYKIMKVIHPTNAISSRAMDIMNSFLNDIFERLASEAAKLVLQSKQRTLTSRDVQTAVTLTLPGELAKYAMNEGAKAVQIYNSSR